MAELVRRALVATYPTPGIDYEAALEQSFGAWPDRDFDSAEYVESLRPGLGRRLDT